MISIHAPTNGATSIISNTDVSPKISIHAPTNGATCLRLHINPPAINFNPRSDERSDVRGMASFGSLLNFNPRSDERSDFCAVCAGSNLSFYFNPRSDERSDNIFKRWWNEPSYFNPRSDERSDVALYAMGLGGGIISIHAPTNGATFLLMLTIFSFSISIHAPTNGATLIYVPTHA